MRPGFQLSMEESAEAILNAVKGRLRDESGVMNGLVAKGRIELHVPRSEEHLWSPQLVVDLEESEGTTTLNARFGPHPSIWTMFLAGYAISAVVAFMALMFAAAELTMGTPPRSLWFAGGAGLAALGVYLLALAGQGFGEGQMGALRSFLEETLDQMKASKVDRSSPRASTAAKVASAQREAS